MYVLFLKVYDIFNGMAIAFFINFILCGYRKMAV